MNEALIRRIATWVLVAGAVVIVGGLGFALWQSFSDGARPDTRDLELARVALPAGENGFVVLESVVPMVKWDGDLHMYSWSILRKWDQGKVDVLLAQNEKALELLDKALGMPGFQFPDVKSVPQWNYLTAFQNLARTRAYSSINHWNRKDAHMAFEESFQGMEFARRIENGGGVSVHFVVGVSLEALALNTIVRFVPEASAAHREELRAVLSRLEPFEDHAASFCNGLKTEFASWNRSVDDVVARKIRVWDLLDSGGYGFKPPPVPDFLFQPNTTRTMLAETTRQILREAPLNYGKTSREPGQLEKLDKMSGSELVLSQNVIGRVIYKSTAGQMLYTAVKRYRITTMFATTRALIAVRLYWLDHGKLPATLDDLVPTYLKSVPLDAFDGKPLRYSPVNKVIYSVGRDLTDRGGDSAEGNPDGDRQPTVKIGW